MSTRKALLHSFLDRYSGLVITLGTNMAVARLLAPSEVGVFSIVMVMVGFVALFRDLGAGQYLVRHPDLDESELRRCLTLQITMGILLALIVWIAARPAADFYRDDRIEPIGWIMATTFLLNPLMAYPVAWLTREMRFGQLMIIRVLGAVCCAAVTLTLSAMGWGPIGLALGNLATTLSGVMFIHVWLRPPLPWRPLWDGLEGVFRFGGQLTLVSIMQALRAGLPELFVARAMGVVPASMLSRGQGLCSLFESLVVNSVNQVMIPEFARSAREGRDLGELAGRATSLMVAVGWPFMACLAVLSEPLIRVLFGPQWSDAVGPARWVALAMAATVPVHVLTAAQLALGRTRDLIGLNALMLLGTAGAAVVGLWTDLHGFAAALALTSLAACALGLWRWGPSAHLSCGRMAQAGLQGLLLTGAGVLGPMGLVLALHTQTLVGALGVLLGSAALALPCWLLCARALRHPVWQEVSRRAAFNAREDDKKLQASH